MIIIIIVTIKYNELIIINYIFAREQFAVANLCQRTLNDQ